MGQRENCSSQNDCPVNPDDLAHCCVTLVCSRDLVAESIAQGLEKHEQIFLQDRFTSVDELFEFQGPSCYEVILISARLLEYPLTEFFQRLQKKSPRARFIVVAAEADHPFLKSLMRAGVNGFLPIDASINELCEAILAVKSGQLWFDKSLLDEVIFDAMEFERLIEQSIRDRIDVLKEQLTNRERDVFSLVLEGLSTKEIAEQIHMSEPTVKQHLTSLFKKFDVNNRSQLILSAFERVCPVTNMVKLFRRTLDKRRTDKGKAPLISDPLEH